jgi:hypothetical protein
MAHSQSWHCLPYNRYMAVHRVVHGDYCQAAKIGVQDHVMTDNGFATVVFGKTFEAKTIGWLARKIENYVKENYDTMCPRLF